MKTIEETCMELDIPLIEFSILDYLKNPKSIGAIASSSPALGDAMASMLPNNGKRYIVELGPGDGALTRHITASGVSDRDLILIELEEKFIPGLEKEFPNAIIITGSATDLLKICKEHGHNDIRAIVSGLPLRSLPLEVTKSVIEQIGKVLSAIKGTRYIQFTYDPRGTPSFLSSVLQHDTKLEVEERKFVMRNIPPAYAECMKLSE
jgi:phosphatidylethanolamine/phosphatidyl-N-methylethanolamine N-methyltransferase